MGSCVGFLEISNYEAGKTLIQQSSFFHPVVYMIEMSNISYCFGAFSP